MSALAGANAATNAPINYTGLNVGTSMWNAPVPVFWGRRRLSTNAVAFANFTSKPADGKGKGGGGKGDQQKTYSAAVALALCEGPLDATAGITNIWANGSTTTVSTLSHLNMTAFLGTQSQAPWSYFATNYPALALAYAETAYVACPNLALGESATIPDNGFECVRTLSFGFVNTQATGGWINPSTHQQSPATDCLMSDIVTDFLASTQYGMGFTSADLGPIGQYAAYQQAQGLFFSPLLVSQEKATETIDRWAKLSNAWIYWSGTQIQFVPLGDAALAANGVTYTPVQDAAYDLTLNDFLAPSGKDDGPVKVTRIDPADAYNRTVLDITDRTLGYIDNPFEWKDQTLVDQFGLRDDSSTQADEICDPAVAKIAVQLIGKRAAYIRNTYAFKTSYRFILCLPGTILTLTEPNIGLNAVRVRVKTIAEDDKEQLSFVCEEFPGTVGTYVSPAGSAAITAGASFTIASTYITLAAAAPVWLTTLVASGATVSVTDQTTGDYVGVVATISGVVVYLAGLAFSASAGSADSLSFANLLTGSTPNLNLPPGNVNTPAIVEPNSAFTGGAPKIIIAASGGVNGANTWGGCNVLVSFNGTDYSQIGTIIAPARQGVLTAALAAYGGANPDTIHTLSVNCAESFGIPAQVTNADAQANRSLSMIAAQPTLSGGAYVVPANGELLSFGAVTATATYAANLTYLERGQYGTAAAAHNVGDQWTAINVAGTDGTSVAYDLPPAYVGQPIYIKFLSFNVFGYALQDPSSVVEYVYTPTGAGFGAGAAGAPATPTGLLAAAGSTQVSLSWNANAATDNVDSYSLYRAPGTGSSFGSASLIWKGLALAFNDTTVASSAGYTYFLEADNAVGASGATAGVNATTGTSSGGATIRASVASGGTYAVVPSALTYYVDLTAASPITVALPASPTTGQIIVVTDEGGDAGTNVFTIKTGASVITTVQVNSGYAALRWNGANWLQGV